MVLFPHLTLLGGFRTLCGRREKLHSPEFAADLELLIADQKAKYGFIKETSESEDQ